jgi:hypothetical protein
VYLSSLMAVLWCPFVNDQQGRRRRSTSKGALDISATVSFDGRLRSKNDGSVFSKKSPDGSFWSERNPSVTGSSVGSLNAVTF